MQTPHMDSEQQLIDNLLKSGIVIPPQPAVLIEMEQLLGKPNTKINTIANLVAKDAGISAMVFKVISSPAYGMGKQADSLEKAISVIGLTQMANIVKSVALRQSLGGDAKFYEVFWEHSGEVAQLASTIAWKQRSVCNIYPDQAYMAGLFHDCGVPILMQRFPEYGQAWPDLMADDKKHDTDHCVTGFLIARHWRLPDFICQTVRFHHEILHTEHKATTMVAILQMAMHIHNIYAHNPDPEWENNRPRVLEELGIGLEGLKEFEEEVYDTFKGS
jgi:putative nucleotidyltransferase with HDIG domain